MTISKFLKTASVLALFAVTTQSCVQDNEWDIPPIACENKFNAATITLADFVAMAPSSGTYTIPADGAEVIVEGYVVSSDEHGNFYNTISIQDKPENPTVGLQIETRKVNNYSDMPVGAKIRIRANGLVLGTDRGVKKLGSVDPSYAIGRIPDIQFKNYVSGVCENGKMVVEPIVPLQLPSLSAAQNAKYINMLVSVPNVQFASSEIGKAFVDLNPAADTDRAIEDVLGGTSVLRNSGYSTFGATKIPEGNGTLTFVVSRYNTSWQMLIRSLDDVNFDKKRFTKIFAEDFKNLDNWNIVSISGDEKWSIATFGNPRPSAMMNGFANRRNNVNEDWLISNPIELSSSYTKVDLTFETDGRYNGNPLEVFVTTNYTGNPQATSWVALSEAVLDSDLSSFGVWQNSGKLDLSKYIGKNIHIAFKYTSTAQQSSTWQIDNIVLTAE